MDGQLIHGNVTLEEFLYAFQTPIDPIEQLFANYRCAMMEVETRFRVLDEQFKLLRDGNPIVTIKTRIKSYDSILEKMRRKQVPMTIASLENHIQDVAGIRVVCGFEEDIYLLANCLINQDDIILIEKRDYIRHPKASGYRSLHLIAQVPIYREQGRKMMTVEVQLRTIAMDFWATLEHKMRYKKNVDPRIKESISEELVRCSDISAALDKRMQNVRNKMLRLPEK